MIDFDGPIGTQETQAWASDLAEGLPVALSLAAADTAEVPALKALAEAHGSPARQGRWPQFELAPYFV